MKKKLVIFGVIFCVLVFLYSAMVISVSDLTDSVAEVMSGRIPEDETEGKAIARYNYSDILLNAEVDVSIDTLFVVHNFHDGYMWIKYSYVTTKNDDSRGIMPASFDVISRWKIHRQNGKWEITEIKEAP